VESASPRITARTRLLGVLGFPVEHSVSPEMHNAALLAAGVPLVYAAFSVAPDGLEAALRGMAAMGFVGANLTIPHKQAGAKLMASLTEEARALGAINTVCFAAGGMVGHNTDVEGFLQPLRRAGMDLAGLPATVLGAGGAARGVVYGLLRSGARVWLINRSRDRAVTLAADMARAVDGPERICVLDAGSDAARTAVRQSALLVNATSAGMSPYEDIFPPVSGEWLHPGLTVVDLVYRPAETRLLRAAREAGCRTINGLPMLVHQGAASFRMWLGMEPDLSVMEKAALAALNDSS
jgi:shikimate dehydrogenase